MEILTFNLKKRDSNSEEPKEEVEEVKPITDFFLEAANLEKMLRGRATGPYRSPGYWKRKSRTLCAPEVDYVNRDFVHPPLLIVKKRPEPVGSDQSQLLVDVAVRTAKGFRIHRCSRNDPVLKSMEGLYYVADRLDMVAQTKTLKGIPKNMTDYLLNPPKEENVVIETTVNSALSLTALDVVKSIRPQSYTDIPMGLEQAVVPLTGETWKTLFSPTPKRIVVAKKPRVPRRNEKGKVVDEVVPKKLLPLKDRVGKPDPVVPAGPSKYASMPRFYSPSEADTGLVLVSVGPNYTLKLNKEFVEYPLQYRIFQVLNHKIVKDVTREFEEPRRGHTIDTMLWPNPSQRTRNKLPKDFTSVSAQRESFSFAGMMMPVEEEAPVRHKRAANVVAEEDEAADESDRLIDSFVKYVKADVSALQRQLVRQEIGDEKMTFSIKVVLVAYFLILFDKHLNVHQVLNVASIVSNDTRDKVNVVFERIKKKRAKSSQVDSKEKQIMEARVADFADQTALRANELANFYKMAWKKKSVSVQARRGPDPGLSVLSRLVVGRSPQVPKEEAFIQEKSKIKLLRSRTVASIQPRGRRGHAAELLKLVTLKDESSKKRVGDGGMGVQAKLLKLQTGTSKKDATGYKADELKSTWLLRSFLMDDLPINLGRLAQEWRAPSNTHPYLIGYEKSKISRPLPSETSVLSRDIRDLCEHMALSIYPLAFLIESQASAMNEPTLKFLKWMLDDRIAHHKQWIKGVDDIKLLKEREKAKKMRELAAMDKEDARAFSQGVRLGVFKYNLDEEKETGDVAARASHNDDDVIDEGDEEGSDEE